METEIISLRKFLMLYLNITYDRKYKITHRDVKVLFPDLKRASLDDIRKDPYLLITKKIVLVNDGRNVVPYIKPMILDEEMELTDIDIEVEHRRSYDFDNMTKNELKALFYENNCSKRDKYKAKRELADRGVELKRKPGKKYKERRDDYGEY